MKCAAGDPQNAAVYTEVCAAADPAALLGKYQVTVKQQM